MPKIQIPQIVHDATGRACVSMSEAARRLGVTPEGLRQAIQRGLLTSSRFGPLRLVPLDDLKHYKPDPKKIGRKR